MYSSEDLLPADRIFDAIALRLSAYALHEASHRLVPTGMGWMINPNFYSENSSIDRSIGSDQRRHRCLEILGCVVPQALPFVRAIQGGPRTIESR